jgi:putative hydrolase of the HAD superfamily
MSKPTSITCLFVDVGGVLLSNGWDHKSRKKAADTFDLNFTEMEARHHLNFETYEEGKLSLDEYLDRVVFYEDRSFTHPQFRRFMFGQSHPYLDMIQLVTDLKERYGLKIIVVSNEGREVNAYRIREFRLAKFVDAFISSCFVHLRKPDADIFELALDIAQVPAANIAYLENTELFADVAASFGIRGVLHTDYKTTCEKLDVLGLTLTDHALVKGA